MKSLKQLTDLANQLLKQVDVGREYTMGYVVNRLEKAIDEYPHDSVIRSVASVVNKQADKGKMITSQKELYSIYNHFAGMSANTMIKEAIGDILYPVDNDNIPHATISNETAFSYRSNTPDLSFTVENNPLEHLFDKNVQAGAYFEPTLAKLGKSVLAEELKLIGVPADNIKVLGGVGENTAIVFDVSFTNKLGTAHVPMFVETSNGVQPPTHFYGNNTFIELTAESLNKYIVESAALEPALPSTTMTGIRTSSGVFSPSFSFEEDAPADIQFDKVALPDSLKDLANFENALVEASTNFSPELVKSAKSICLRELSNMGLKAQVAIADSTDNCIICSAELDSAVGKVEIKLPVEIIGNRPQIPALFYNEANKDRIYDFSKNEVVNYLTAMKTDNGQILRYSNDFFNMTYNQLKEEIMAGVANKDYLRAEQALSRIEDKFGSSYHMAAMSDYSKYLSHVSTPEEKPQHKCRLLITTGSIGPRCGHYNVPLNRVATNQKGDCELIDRKAKYDNLAESTGTLMRSNKIVLT